MTINFKFLPTSLHLRKKPHSNNNDNKTTANSSKMASEPTEEDKSRRSMKDYRLLVTAGPSRDVSTHKPVPVNSEEPLKFDTDDVSCDVFVRIRNYRGPSSSSNKEAVGGLEDKDKLDEAKRTSSYFEHPLHGKDQYSISFSPIVFKGKEGVSGDDLVLGNDFDKSISKALPPGFGVAWRVARYLIDPGLDGDPWADKPWLEGPVLSSVNALSHGDKPTTSHGTASVVEETLGADLNSTYQQDENEAGGNILDIPQSSSDRMKYFLKKDHREAFSFQPEEKYHMDFYNPYLDFNEFALKLPGVTIRILKYWDGQPLRYVLKNRKDQKVYMVVQFMLVEREDKKVEGAESSEESAGDEDHIDEETMKAHGSDNEKEDKGGKSEVQDTSPDDVD